MKKAINKPIYILILLAIAIILICFGKIIFHANAYLLSSQGDAIKNYYTPAWFIQYDRAMHFSGLNYPYGEHVVFTDNQPALSWLLNFIDNNLFPIAGQTVGIINLLIFISLLFSIILLFRILVFYKLPEWYAVIAALLIGFGGPQLMRISGHFALAYTVYFPLLWWLNIKVRQHTYNPLPVAVLICTITFFSFIHVYYLFLALLFFGSLLFSAFFYSTSKREFFNRLLIVVLPICFSMAFMELTDPVSDRTNSPYGFFQYRATFLTVFTNPAGNFAQWLTNTFHFIPPDFEGYAYTGVAGFIVLFASLWLFFRRWALHKKIARAFIHLPADLGKVLFASTLVLLFSMSLPFSLGLQSLLDVIPFIKQFRSPGRLAWIFYYVFTVYAAILIYLLFRLLRLKNILAAQFLVFTILFFQSREFFLHLRDLSVSTLSGRAENPFRLSSPELSKAGIQSEEFQAILFFPSFFQGSEKIYIDRTDGDFRRALEISYQTGLPLINQMMSRTSISQSLKLASLTGHPAIEKTLPAGLNEKPLLLISNGRNLSRGEDYLVGISGLIGTLGDLYVYRLAPSEIEGSSVAFMRYFNTKRDTLHFFENTYWAIDSISLFYRNGFEEEKSPESFLGTGSYYREKAGRTLLAEIPVRTNQIIWIEVSYWVKSYASTSGFPHLKVDLVTRGEKWLYEYSVNAKFSADIIGDWVRGAENFEVKPDIETIRIYCAEGEYINLDELVVRHTAFDVFYGSGGEPNIYNNYPLWQP